MLPRPPQRLETVNDLDVLEPLRVPPVRLEAAGVARQQPPIDQLDHVWVRGLQLHRLVIDGVGGVVELVAHGFAPTVASRPSLTAKPS